MKSYTVIYRTGGTVNFEWKKCQPTADRAAAYAMRNDIEKMGYKALVHDTNQLEIIGLPSTYEA